MSDTLETIELEVTHSAKDAASEIGKVAGSVTRLANALSKAIPSLKIFNGLMGKSSFTVNNNSTTQIADSISNVTTAAQKAKGATKGISSGMAGLSRAASKTKGPLENFLSSLKRIAMYRLLRSIIKGITSAFTEGLQKAYIFSSGIEGEGHRFAEALDRMKSAGNQAKGQLGSAFISLLAAIQPILIAIINLITKVADAISQLFAAFTGKTYLKANATAAKFADNMAAGAGAAKEWKNQLLGFDEINRLNEPSGGGGGGGGANPLEGFDFEDSPIAQKWLDFAQKIKDAIAWIKDHMELVKGLAIAIGIAFLAWKLANIIAPLLGIETGLAKVALGVALVTGGFVALGIGMHQWITTGELTNQTLALIEIGLLAIGAGLSLLTGSWIPLAVAAAVAAIVLIITRWDELKRKLQEFDSSLSQHLGNGKLEWQDFAAVAVGAILKVMGTIETIIGWVQTLVGWLRTLHTWIQDAIDGFNALNFVKNANARAGAAWDDGSIWLQGFASGGFPDEGQLFVSREAGPEMVGTIGGRTAVANNDQIVEGIRQGVYEAVMAANSNGNNDVSVRVYLDSREIKTGQQRLARSMGVG